MTASTINEENTSFANEDVEETSPTEETFEAQAPIINKNQDIIDKDADGVPPAGDEEEDAATTEDAAASNEPANVGEETSNDKKRESPEPVPHDVPDAKRIQLVVEAKKNDEEVAATKVAADEVAASAAAALEESDSSTSVAAPAAAIEVAVQAWDQLVVIPCRRPYRSSSSLTTGTFYMISASSFSHYQLPAITAHMFHDHTIS